MIKYFISNYCKWSFIGLVVLSLLACAETEEDTNEVQTAAATEQPIVQSEAKPQLIPSIRAPSNRATKPAEPAFKTIEWTDLIPPEDLDALLNPPSYITDIEDGSFEDQISNQIQNTIVAANDDRYQQALVSTHVVETMHKQAIRIPGFVVPLELNDKRAVTQFFLVPFFGACLHLPPPPPNQIIFVDYPQGLKVEALHFPFWISGVLQTELTENDMATAAYTMQMQSFELYVEG